MKTDVIKITEETLETKESKNAIQKAGDIIKKGGLVAFPTETVYGLGGDALQAQSSRKIYAAKGRPSDNPLIIHIGKWEDIYAITTQIPDTALKLAKEFWPGPLTMILNKSDRVPYETTGGLQTVAIRMPSDKVALAFINAAGGYVAGPSANTSGRPSPTLAKYVEEDLQGKIEMIIDGGQVCIGIESTIIDLSEKVPVILRPGYITKEKLEKVIGKVEVDQTILNADSNKIPKAPGMKYKHYAPKGDLTIIDGSEKKVIIRINQLVENALQKNKKVGVIGTDLTVKYYKATSVKSVGNRAEEETVARELYKVLREFDDEEMDIIYSESFEHGELGPAIMNRLLKAAGHHVEKID